ncbi:mucin-16 [Prinia subflava]|uniref:mucin-16 n=1 Tax=Prinia subflava TaxID=208062 RepID=UPI002FDF53DA
MPGQVTTEATEEPAVATTVLAETSSSAPGTRPTSASTSALPVSSTLEITSPALTTTTPSTSTVLPTASTAAGQVTSTAESTTVSSPTSPEGTTLAVQSTSQPQSTASASSARPRTSPLVTTSTGIFSRVESSSTSPSVTNSHQVFSTFNTFTTETSHTSSLGLSSTTELETTGIPHSSLGFKHTSTQPPTRTPANLERFTVNFTITNLPYSSDLENPDSARFKATQKVMKTLLDNLLKESSIGPDFHGCVTTAFRPGSHRDETRVDAVCTYSKEPWAAPLDRVGLYHQVSNKTRGITQLGPYSLDKDSLYVNGYNEQPVLTTPTQLPTTTAAISLERFTVNFTITNLPYSSDLENPDSAKFKATQKVMNTLLDRLLKESSIGPTFQGCETTDFRPGTHRDETRVDAVCTYSKEPWAAPLDRVGLYHQVSNKTRGITQLGPYSLDKDSLYVNGYNEQPLLTTPTQPPTTTAAALEHFTINFTITNLPYSSDLENPDSARLRATQRVMNTLLDRLLKESSIGPVFQGCETTDFRPGSHRDETRVDAVCTYSKEPWAAPLDRVGLYHQVSNKTRGITQLGPYSLDKDSLYVNGYNEQPVLTTPTQPPTTTAAALEHFTVNFTITNLPYSSDLENPDSAKFRATRKVMNTLLDRLLKESSIGPVFQGCETTDFRPGSHRDETRVDAVCTYSKEPWAAPLDRVGLYHQVSNKTRGITQLGPYSLDKDSLYVNGYNEQPVLTTPTQPSTSAISLEHFTVNFTITNLPYTSDLENPDSARFRATQRVMNTLLDRLLKESSIGPVFQGCETTDFRPGSHRDETRVDAVCTYSKEPWAAPLDRVGLYHQVSNKTRGITQLGPYSLDKDSLYVNGYNEQPVLTSEYLTGVGWDQKPTCAQLGPTLRHLHLSMQISDTLALALYHSIFVLFPAPTQPPTTTAAALEHFTVNFTITNLPYSSDLENPDSAKFRATRRVMNMMLNRLLKESSIGPVFQGCETDFRPGSHRDETRVDAVCTYSKEPWAAPLDRVGLYHQVSNKTRGITQLGPYSLDKDSLYVNGYNEQPVLTTPTQPSTSAISLEHFTVNFTITNLPYTSDLENPDSARFRATQRVMNTLLDRLLKESSIGPVFQGCETTDFRPGSHRDETRVDAVCTYSKEPWAAPLDRVGLYHQVSNKTRGITQLGPYSLDKDSLYVNGYNEQPVLTTPTNAPTTTAAALERFTINFTTTNLPYSSELENPDSAKFKATQKVMNTLLDRLLKESSIGPAFQGCETTDFRPGSHRDETRVDAVCTYSKEPWAAPLDRVGLYHQVSNKTRGITQLGPYSLDKDSLYVNGYNEQPVLTTPTQPPTTTAAALERFTINFTITNLPYSSDLENPDSAKFRATRKVMNTLLDRLLKESSIGPVFQGCETTDFRPGSHRDETRVDAVCTYSKEPWAAPLDRVGLYHQVSNKTRGITQLGPYSLDKDSLYVNGYNEQPVLTTPTQPLTTTAAALERFTVNFTITNLPYSSDLENPDSAKFRATRRVMNMMLDRLLKKSSIGPAFQGCETTNFRPGSHRDETRVDAVCTYSKEPWAAPLDRVGLYHQVSNKTRGITQLGPYSLDKDSLYVNGYNEQPVLTSEQTSDTLALALCHSIFVLFPAPTQPPTTTAAALEHFTVNFTITNLPYSSDLENPDSAKFRATRKVMNTLLDRLLKESSIGPVFQGCETTDFRPGSHRDETRVDAVCTYSKEPWAAPLDRVGLYHQVSNKTRGITQLGPYSLDKDSLYVNGYNEQPVLTTPTHPPTTTAAISLEHFTVNFTITNLPYSSDLENPDSAKFRATRRVMNMMLDRLLKESSIGPAFQGCETTNFRPGSHRDETRVDAVCTYSKEPWAAPLDRVGLYHQVSNKTRGITQLGPYSLDKDSLYVNGYNEQPLLTTPTQPPTTTAAALKHFTVNFTITNLPYSSDLENPDSAKFRATRKVMNTLLDRLLKESSIGPVFQGCETTDFRPGSHRDETRVDAVCTYSKEPWAAPLDRVGLYHQVSNKTRGITQLGPYSLDKDSLYVNGYNEQPLLTTHTNAPTTTAAALEHFTVNFTTTNLPYSSELENPDSAKFKATQKVMNTLLDRLLKESSIGPAFQGCETTDFRPGSHRDETRVDAVCTYSKEPWAAPLDRVGLYHQVSNKTRGITQLGPYSLDKDSLYVNGYNEQPLLTTPTHPPTTAAISPEHFTVNFTITNLPYSSDLENPDSAKFRATRRVMNMMLDRLLKESSIGPAFQGCETTNFRPGSHRDETRVDAVCTYSKEPWAAPLDRVGLYHQVSNKTRGITQLGPYSLDKDSLYVNGYNEQPVLTSEQGSCLSFPMQTGTITRPLYLCRPISDTLALALCYSIFVLFPAPTHPSTTTAAALEHFTVNFTTTNLPYSSDLENPDSAKFRATRRVMNMMLDRLLKESSIGPAFHGCEATDFSLKGKTVQRRVLKEVAVFCRPGSHRDETRVDAVCTYSKEPWAAPLDRVGLYHQVSNKTRGITQLGPYSLDKDSLYVNGYNEQPMLTTPTHPSTTTAAISLEHFTVNFTITNLPYSSDLENPDSAKFRATRRVMNLMLDRLLKESSIGPAFQGCETTDFRPGSHRDETRVDAVCTYSKEPWAAPLDRVGLYHQVSNKTRGITQLGPYSLDKDSLYVNGHHEVQPGLSADQSTQPLAPAVKNFTLNFTITNLQFSADLQNPSSRRFKSTEKVMYHYVDPLLQRSSIGPAYIGCKVMAFRSTKNRDDTGVDAMCSYRDEPSDPKFNRTTVYRELSKMTSGITKLGHYSLNSQSLYVNGYNEAHSLSSVKSTTTQSPGATTEHFTLNLTITNLMFTTDLQTPNSRKFRSTEKIMKHYIDSLLQKSSIGPHFTGCKVMGFGPEKNRDSTGVDTTCSYRKDSQVPKFNPAEVYQELKGMTSGITKLGIYSLDKKSLYVNGYNEPLERAPRSTTAAPKPTSRNFTLNFTLTNLRYTADLAAPNSRRFLSTVKVMNHYLDPLFKRSSISSAYTGCKAMRFRSGRHRDDTKVDAVCSYRDNASLARFDREKLYQELSTMTNNVTKLGHYSLDSSSLYVDGFTLTGTAATKKPLLTAAKQGYRLSFRIVNENLTNPDSQSPEYRAAVESITNKMNHLYRQSDLRDQFLTCRITRLRPGSIVVDCQCFFQPHPNISRAVVERTFQDRTSNPTGLWLGSSYRLQEFSVDTLELSVEAATHKTPLESGKENFGLNFRISNLPYSPELQDASSQMYQENKEKIEKELEVFRNSHLKDQFVGCTVERFGPVHGKGHTEVASICKFTPDPLSGSLQEQEVFEELKLLTQGFTRLGPSYELEKQSLEVEGYSPLKTDEPEPTRSELQFWAIILICLFTLLGFILLLLLCFLVLSCLRRKSHLYQVQQGLYGLYFPHLSTGKVH